MDNIKISKDAKSNIHFAACSDQTDSLLELACNCIQGGLLEDARAYICAYAGFETTLYKRGNDFALNCVIASDIHRLLDL